MSHELDRLLVRIEASVDAFAESMRTAQIAINRLAESFGGLLQVTDALAHTFLSSKSELSFERPFIVRMLHGRMFDIQEVYVLTSKV